MAYSTSLSPGDQIVLTATGTMEQKPVVIKLVEKTGRRARVEVNAPKEIKISLLPEKQVARQ